MKSIAYLVPYFGKLPVGFKMWLLSCAANETIDWILLTDDRTEYNYPNNVKVHYCTYDSIKERIQNNFDFPIVISKPWKLCDFRPAYGEIFSDELKTYDYWGHCDMDLIFGDIRAFITDEILEKYDKIGFQGHSVIYRNTPEVNQRYRNQVENAPNYKMYSHLVMENFLMRLVFAKYTMHWKYRIIKKPILLTWIDLQRAFICCICQRKMDIRITDRYLLGKMARLLEII